MKLWRQSRSRRATPIAAVGLATLAFAMATPGWAETRSLTIASSHPTTVPWVGVLHSHVQPELNRRLADAEVDLQIDWIEAYGGALYNLNDTLEAVGDGLTDIGWVGTLWEGSKMPLQNVTYFAPFVTDDMHAVLDTMNELHATIPAMEEAWLAQNQVFLGTSGVDTYHLMTNFPIESLADLEGRKILAPGPAAKWLEGTGAVAVDGGLPTYYTQIQTGVADGVVIILSGAYPFKIHEVAPHITLVGIGAQAAGAMAINQDTWDSLPPEAQAILAELGREYSTLHADQVNERVDSFKEEMVAEGAIITELPAAEREKWVSALPDIAGEWVEANEAAGLPAGDVLAAYLEGVRARGGRPARDWDQE